MTKYSFCNELYGTDRRPIGRFEASDFLWTKTEGVDQSVQTVTLQFSHRCSKLGIKLVKSLS